MRYDKTTILKTQNGRPYYKSKIYPQIPYTESDIYVITTIGDRLDLLAYLYYKDATLWWIISITNSNVISQGTLYITPGTQLRIPTNVDQVIIQYNQLNKVR